jgi:hypothetical protein
MGRYSAARGCCPRELQAYGPASRRSQSSGRGLAASPHGSWRSRWGGSGSGRRCSRRRGLMRFGPLVRRWRRMGGWCSASRWCSRMGRLGSCRWGRCGSSMDVHRTGGRPKRLMFAVGLVRPYTRRPPARRELVGCCLRARSELWRGAPVRAVDGKERFCVGDRGGGDWCVLASGVGSVPGPSAGSWWSRQARGSSWSHQRPALRDRSAPTWSCAVIQHSRASPRTDRQSRSSIGPASGRLRTPVAPGPVQVVVPTGGDRGGWILLVVPAGHATHCPDRERPGVHSQRPSGDGRPKRSGSSELSNGVKTANNSSTNAR